MSARLILQQLQDGDEDYLVAIARCADRQHLVDAVDEAWLGWETGLS